MIKQEIEKDGKIIKLDKNKYLNAAFDKIPSNSIIDKGRPGIGGTTMELDSSRHSIIVVPNTSIIENKMEQFDNLFGVYGSVSKHKLEHYIIEQLEQNNSIKIMSTPDSFYKIIEASKNVGYDVFSSSFLLLDECHSFITEGTYRENITKPFDYFWEFKEKALISATPYSFTDPRFDGLDRIKIETEHLNNTIEVVFTEDIYAVLKSIIEQIETIEENQGLNIHIFFNNVKAIPPFIRLLNLDYKEEIRIFCANTSDNRGKLDKFKDIIFEYDGADDMSKYRFLNFYTTKYWEGWDLYDEKAVIVLVSDINNEHTCFNIGIKGVQAVGRLRNKAEGVYHITNIVGGQDTDIDVTTENIKESAQNLVITYNGINDYLLFRDNFDITAGLRNTVKKFADFDSINSTATINLTKVDSNIYSTLSKATYANKQSIISAWEKAGYKVKATNSNIVLSFKDRRLLFNSRIGSSNKNMLIADKIKQYNDNLMSLKMEDGGLLINFSGFNEYRRLIHEYPEIYKYYTTLGYDQMKQLGFSSAKMKKAYIFMMANKYEASEEVKQTVYLTFKSGEKYPSAYIKSEFNKIYESFGIRPTKKVTAACITRYFDAAESTYRINGKSVKGYYLYNKK